MRPIPPAPHSPKPPSFVVELAPYRRARTAARLAGRPCPDCGTEAWHVTERGDAFCGRCHPGPEVAP